MEYSATFSAIAIAAAQDVFEITAPANSRVRITGFLLGQYSDAGDGQGELLSLQIIRGFTVSGSGGASVTPTNLNSSSDVVAGSAIERNNTTLANTGTTNTPLAHVWNVRIPYKWTAEEDGPKDLTLEPGERAVVRITLPVDSITSNGTLFFEEIGKMPVA